MEDKKWDLLALASIPLMMTLGNSMFIPVLPLIEHEINITSFQSSLIISVYSITAILCIPVSGYLSDKWGRKKIMVPSLLMVAAGGAVSAFASWQLDQPYLLILLGRIVQGVGSAGAFPVVLPTVGDMFKQEEQVSRGLGIIETANTLGKVLSPIIGALLAVLVWYMPFMSVPVLSMISVFLVWFLVKVPRTKQKEDKSFSVFLTGIKKTFLFNGRWLCTVFFIGGILMFVLFGVLFHLSSLLEDQYHLKGYIKGLLLAVPLLFLCSTSYLSGKLIGENRQKMRGFILIGAALTTVSLVFVREDMTLLWLLTLLSSASIGIGLALPCLDALITEGIEKEERGLVTSFYSSMRFAGVAAGPPITALLMKHQSSVIYFVLATASLLIIAAAFVGIRPSKTSQSP
ncbi:MFS transporter [Salibacterium halotolerans]|uniref:MFS transporter, ACDE family, multidrug resistance protein n=1 Tax=Salibacterium halotolerans TaxID=1884432 RepID=A0A1I5QIY0_9BACI|nr:MFS transporter, ACDE family, multidrug resistance protein [Salibacterium halotolerans]